MEYYQLAADGGVAAGWRSIGFLYQYGLGVELDYGKAYDCFQRAAEQGDLQAMFNLGEYFREGKAQEKDLDKAAEWYRKALDAGYQPKEEEQEILKAVLGDSYTQMLE